MNSTLLQSWSSLYPRATVNRAMYFDITIHVLSSLQSSVPKRYNAESCGNLEGRLTKGAGRNRKVKRGGRADEKRGGAGRPCETAKLGHCIHYIRLCYS